MRSQPVNGCEEKRMMNHVPQANEVGARLSTVGTSNTAYDGLVAAMQCFCKPLSGPTVSAKGASISILKLQAGASSGEGAWLGVHPFHHGP
jgi:hypothetical protein